MRSRNILNIYTAWSLFVVTICWCCCFNVARADGSDDIPSQLQLQAFTDDPVKIYGTTAVYQVFRNGKTIGKHTLTFTRQDKELTIAVDTNLVVKVLGVTAYRYRYTGEEVWSGGDMVSITSHIKDNRKALRTIEALNRGNYWTITKKGVERTASSPEFSSNYWHPGVLFAARLYHTLHGRVYRGKASALGWEPVVSEEGVARRARKFQFSQGYDADVWYDEHWRWLKLEFLADDGSRILFNCISCGET